MVTLHIPQGVYYNLTRDYFYDEDGNSMGGIFWQDWRHLRNHFPKSAKEAKDKTNER